MGLSGNAALLNQLQPAQVVPPAPSANDIQSAAQSPGVSSAPSPQQISQASQPSIQQSAQQVTSAATQGMLQSPAAPPSAVRNLLSNYLGGMAAGMSNQAGLSTPLEQQQTMQAAQLKAQQDMQAAVQKETGSYWGRFKASLAHSAGVATPIEAQQAIQKAGSEAATTQETTARAGLYTQQSTYVPVMMPNGQTMYLPPTMAGQITKQLLANQGKVDVANIVAGNKIHMVNGQPYQKADDGSLKPMSVQGQQQVQIDKATAQGLGQPQLEGQSVPLDKFVEYTKAAGIKTQDFGALGEVSADRFGNINNRIGPSPSLSKAELFAQSRLQIGADPTTGQVRFLTPQEAASGNYTPVSRLNDEKLTGTASIFDELNQNISQVKQNLQSIAPGTKIPAPIIAMAMQPKESMMGQLFNSAVLSNLSPDQQNLIFAVRNLREMGLKSRALGALTPLRSDKQTQLLLNQLPSPETIASGDPDVVQRQLQSFEGPINAIGARYKTLLSSVGQSPAQVGNPKPQAGALKIIRDKSGRITGVQ